jgi:Uncharacterised nucleotidyltransferase
MPSRGLKRAILSALQAQPDFSGLTALTALREKGIRDLLLWLDHSGLALVFLHRLQLHGAANLVPVDLRDALAQRLQRNFGRVRDMVEEFQRLTRKFSEYGVFAATLKGFTLIPDFCEAVSLRHQIDFDFFIDSANVDAATEALRSCGYSILFLCKTGESCFTTPLRHVPTRHDDIYSVQRHRRVELHTSLWENVPWMTVSVPTDCLNHVEPAEIHSVQYFGFSLEDKFLMQVLHAFRHCSRSWLRLSWLLEIARCMQVHFEEEALWRHVIARAGDDPLTKRIFAFVLGLANGLFACRIPSVLLSWSSSSMTRSVRAWLDYFSVDWAIADLPGSLSNLFLMGEFIEDPISRLHYFRSRLLPRSGLTSIGDVTSVNGHNDWKMKSARLRYVAHRSAVHLRDILFLPWQQLRWKTASMLARASALDAKC